MSHFTALRLALPLVLATATAPFAQEQAPTPDSVIATVNGEEITLGHMLVIRARLPQQYDSLPDQVLFDGILDQLMDQTLLAQQAEELDPRNQLIVDNEVRALLSSQIITTLARRADTEDAIRAAYDEEFGDFGGGSEYNASHILVETEEEAMAIVAELEAGADFATLASERSTGPSGPNGGALGWFGEGTMVGEFEEAVVGLEVGAVSDPVETQFGWHVITLNDKRQIAAPAIEDVRAELLELVQRQAVEEHVAEMTRNADITRPDSAQFPASIVNMVDLLQE